MAGTRRSAALVQRSSITICIWFNGAKWPCDSRGEYRSQMVRVAISIALAEPFTDNTYIRDPYGHNIAQPYSGSQTLVNNNVHIEQMDNTVNGGTGLSTDTINILSYRAMA